MLVQTVYNGGIDGKPITLPDHCNGSPSHILCPPIADDFGVEVREVKGRGIDHIGLENFEGLGQE